MNKPLVSVIMPVYNGEKYIRKAVESVYEQEVSLELLVIDDGSTDHTEEVLSAYEGREDFRYIKNQQNMGAAGSRNRGVGLAQGTYIAFLDADDWWEPGKLKEQPHSDDRPLSKSHKKFRGKFQKSLRFCSVPRISKTVLSSLLPLLWKKLQPK